MTAVIVIPARYASQRLPGKPLLEVEGKTLIQYVYEAASKSQLSQDVIVATDDERILNNVHSFGGKAVLTDANHPSGTDRIAEVAREVDGEIFINLQGDEPEIDPVAIDLVIQILQEFPSHNVASLVTRISAEEAENPSLVKVVMNLENEALYFSRSKIPYPRDDDIPEYLGHIGIYGYRKDFLLQYPSLKSSELEKIEKLEQLRVLENGFAIKLGKIQYRSKGIDTPEDFQAFQERIQKS